MKLRRDFELKANTVRFGAEITGSNFVNLSGRTESRGGGEQTKRNGIM